MDDLILCGRKIGTSTGCDKIDDLADMHYSFEPADGIKLPAGDICVNYAKGEIETYDAEGNVTFTTDLIDTLKHLERTQ